MRSPCGSNTRRIHAASSSGISEVCLLTELPQQDDDVALVETQVGGQVVGARHTGDRSAARWRTQPF